MKPHNENSCWTYFNDYSEVAIAYYYDRYRHWPKFDLVTSQHTGRRATAKTSYNSGTIERGNEVAWRRGYIRSLVPVTMTRTMSDREDPPVYASYK